MTVLIKIIQVIISLGLLIILHEGGHFLFAKLFKTRVNKFYLFFDWKFSLFSTYMPWFRKLFGKEPVPKKEDGSYEYRGTEYGIGWIPLGGYVQIDGMIDETQDKDKLSQDPQPWEFRQKKPWQRLLIMLGGVLMNFIVAFFIYAMVLYAWGKSYVSPQDMTYGLKFNSEAKALGFQDGDIIISADGTSFESWQPACLRTLSTAHTATVLRCGKQTEVSLPGDLNLLEMLDEPRFADALMPMCVDSVVPGTPAEEIGLKQGSRITRLNGKDIKDFNDLSQQLAMMRSTSTDENVSDSISLALRKVRVTIAEGDSIREAEALLTPELTFGFVNKSPEYKTTTKEYGFFESIPAGISFGWKQLTNYVSDLKYIFTKKGAKSVGGFITIGNIFPGVWDWQSFWMLTALLSIMLGVVNVLPIPALDGGHALFCIYEIVTGRKPSDTFLQRAQYVGFFILLGLLIFANLNDILRLFGII